MLSRLAMRRPMPHTNQDYIVERTRHYYHVSDICDI
jgi:hypothetical protein